MSALDKLVSPNCRCESASHDHSPGQCPRLHDADNDLCDYCLGLVRAVLEREAFRLGADTLGSKPLGDAPSFPFGEGFSEAFEVRGEGSEAGERGGEAGERPKGRVFNVSVAERIEANDTVEANIDVGFSTEVAIVLPIWHDNNRFNVFLEIDQAQRELEATRAVLLTLEAVRAENPRAHNGPPGLLEEPGIDIESIDTALACLVVLRKVVVRPEPDFDLIRVLWNAIAATLKALGRFVAWLAQLTLAGLKPLWESKFGQGVLQGAGLVVGKHAMEELLRQLIAHGPKGLQAVEQILLHALSKF